MAKKKLLVIDGCDITPYITAESYTTGFYKQWGTDTGRSPLTGTFSGSLVGIFPKITFTLGSLNDSSAKKLYGIFNSAQKDCTYWDSISGETKTAEFYFGDVIDTIRRVCKDGTLRHGQLQIEAVAIKKR